MASSKTQLADSTLVMVLGAPVFYALLVHLGTLAKVDGVSLIWPASGFLIGVLVRQPIYRWMYIGITSAILSTGLFYLQGNTIPQSVLIGFTHLIEIFGVSWAITRAAGSPFNLETTSNLLWFIVFAILIGPLSTAPLGALIEQNHLSTGSFLDHCAQWYFAIALGNLVVGSAIISFKRAPLNIRPEFFALCFSLVIAHSILTLTEHLAAMFLFMPVFFWAAMRFGTSTTCYLAIALGIAANINVMAHNGPLSEIIPNTTPLIAVLQLFMTFAFAPLLVFCVAFHERQKVHKAFSLTVRKNQDLYDKTPVFFYSVNQKGMIDSVNQFCAQSLGYHVGDLINQSVKILYEQPVMACSAAGFDQGDELLVREVNLKNHRGQPVGVREYIRRVDTVDGKSMLQIAAENISEVQRLSAQLTHQSTHDSLTELINRETFELKLIEELNAIHAGEPESALCLLDLDQFKLINDTCGHGAGDELLKQLAGKLQLCISSRDTLARMGGDEFGVLFYRCDATMALMRANQLREAINNFQFHWKNQRFSLTTSTGLVILNDEFRAHTDALAAVDAACYTAKEQGRNRLHLYRSDDDQMRRKTEEMRWASQIEMALDEGRLMLYYQTIKDIKDPHSTQQHHEILVRMIDANGDMVSPAVFIPAAEKYGLAPLIDRWVLENTFAFFHNEPDLQEMLSVTSINLSGQTLVDEHFPAFVQQCFDTYRMPAHKVCFEITETAAIKDINSAQYFIQEMKNMGCLFALDDFGSGLSSFAYLKNLPVDYLKIDGVFVRDIVDDEIDREMVKTINDIGHVTHKKTIAEFVENDAIYALLESIGVDYAQGWAIAKPRPIKEMLGETVK